MEFISIYVILNSKLENAWGLFNFETASIFLILDIKKNPTFGCT